MQNIILSGLTLDDLLLRIKEIIDTKIGSQPPKQTQEQSEYITRKEVAKLLKVTLPTLHDWTKLGWLQSYKIGNRVLYKQTEVEESVQQVLFHKHKKGGML